MQRPPKPIDTVEMFRHMDQSVTYYSISQAKFVNMKLVSETSPFSDSILIEIERLGYRLFIGREDVKEEYLLLSNMECNIHNGQRLIHWTVADKHYNRFTVVKLLAPDGIVQIKLISSDNQTQIIHNVCELPDLHKI
jgi:hypothetical protein